eukprot:CAMPEP_0172852966 /NCGR_PEP_ID=MMETSP1075-20121228/55580_1 /TAXON_ID=2916 /ORGANISM="Ceratium fusus, Strain PA161109" /LENGTH=118 /DNA_ID=CAMNT_0013699355 /DNA_START=59 /DNA_END=412 /DNA_ORIENTATION=+
MAVGSGNSSGNSSGHDPCPGRALWLLIVDERWLLINGFGVVLLLIMILYLSLTPAAAGAAYEVIPWHTLAAILGESSKAQMHGSSWRTQSAVELGTLANAEIVTNVRALWLLIDVNGL